MIQVFLQVNVRSMSHLISPLLFLLQKNINMSKSSKIYIHLQGVLSNNVSCSGRRLHTYALLSYWSSGQADSNNDETGDGKKDDGKIQIVDIRNKCRLWIFLATRRRLIGELQSHANHSHHQSNHQTPKCTLQNEENSTNH